MNTLMRRQSIFNPMRVLLLMATLVATLGAEAQGPDAGNEITSIDYTVQQGGKVVVKIGLKNALQNPPAGFTISNPPRIALDFVNTVNQWGKNSLSINEGALRSINIAQSPGRTRLVLNLSRASAYETQVEGNNYIITVQGGVASAVIANNTAQFAESKDATNHSLRDVDFRRGKNGEGRIIVDLSDTTTGIDIRQQGKFLAIDFINTAVPRNLERRMDVTDFGTPVLTVETFAQGSNARILVEPKGDWEHSAYQSDKKFIVDIKQVVEDPSKTLRAKKYSGDKLSLNFQNVEVRAVLQVIADFTGFNIITSDTVTGNLTLRLKDVPWDQALDIILQSKGLSLRKNGTVIWIAPTDELATKEKLELESKQQILDLEPLTTETFRLRFQRAENFIKLLNDEKQRILSKRGSAVIDPRTNTIFIHDTPSKLDEVRKLIAQVDIPVKQVLIESRIVEASDTFSKNLGVRLGVLDRSTANTQVGFPVSNGGNTRITAGGQIETPGFFTGQAATIPTFNEQALNVNFAAGALGGFRSGALSFVLFNSALGRFLNLELSALQADGRGKIISNPRVVTADQSEATIEQGTEIPYSTVSQAGTTTLFRKAVLGLKVKPQITPDDNVIMDLKINNDSRGTDTPTAGPAINTRQITTQVLVENGGTVVIGGIYTEDQLTTVTKVPLFGDLPLIGALFKNTQNRDNKTELLIFITPRILKDTLNLR